MALVHFTVRLCMDFDYTWEMILASFRHKAATAAVNLKEGYLPIMSSISVCELSYLHSQKIWLVQLEFTWQTPIFPWCKKRKRKKKRK